MNCICTMMISLLMIGNRHYSILSAKGLKPMFLALLFFVIANQSLSQDITRIDSTENRLFQELLDSNRMEFVPPQGLIEVETIDNLQMNYEKAYKHPSKRFEVRYAIRHHDFGFYKSIFEMTVLNISGGQLPEYTPFGSEAVRSEFGADAGATVMVNVTKEFGQDYKYCLLVYIHKKGIGDGYIFYMADDKSIIPDLMMPIFHALKFKEY